MKSPSYNKFKLNNSNFKNKLLDYNIFDRKVFILNIKSKQLINCSDFSRYDNIALSSIGKSRHNIFHNIDLTHSSMPLIGLYNSYDAN